jgi:AraC-like DNA-binding protein
MPRLGAVTIHRDRAVPVSDGLRSWVASISSGAVLDDGQTVLETPDPTATLALRLDPGFEDDLVVLGPRTKALYHQGKSGRAWIKIRVRPEHLRPLFGTTAAELVDQAVPLAALWGDRAVRKLVGGPAVLLSGIDKRVVPGEQNALVRAATELLAAGRQVAETAARLRVSERQLRKVFSETLGLSPKQYARLARIRAAADRAGRTPLARLALETGYYDQAHLTTEFRALMGVPPAAFAKGKLPSAVPCGQEPGSE